MTDYIGRFAPSPTGPLHFGSIVSALASFLDAKANLGQWLLRIDDLDTPRTRAGAELEILHTLETLSLSWDGVIVRQSERYDAYAIALSTLRQSGLLFNCTCTRKNTGTAIYPGTCRHADISLDIPHSTRIKTPSLEIELNDLVQGLYTQNLDIEIGDFVLKRADNIFAYHLASVVDDAFQAVTHIVRGADLLDSTPRQVFLQRALNLKTPTYAHVPLAKNKEGKKISKQDLAENVLLKDQPQVILYACLDFLNQSPNPELKRTHVEEVIDWGIKNWRREAVPNQFSIAAPASLY